MPNSNRFLLKTFLIKVAFLFVIFFALFSGPVLQHNKLSASEEPIAFVMRDDSKNDEIFTLNLETGTINQYTKARLHPRELVWSPNKQYIAFTGSSKTGVTTDSEAIYLLDTTNKQIAKLTDCKFPAGEGGWSEDGEKLYWIMEGRQTRVLVFNNRQLREEIRDPLLSLAPFQYKNVEFQPYNGQERSDYEIVLIENGNKLRLTKNNVLDVYPTLSPDGEKVAFISEINSVPQIVIFNIHESKSQTVTQFKTNRFPRMLAWAPILAWHNKNVTKKTSSPE